MMFSLTTVARSVPKAGLAAGQNEDAVRTAAAAGRAAVADGASEGWQSGPWAVALATAFVKHPPTPATYPEWLAAARATGPQTPAGGSWYAETKALQGAFAALVGVAFEQPKAGPGVKWRAVAVGDCCLFHVRDGKLLARFPVESEADFTNHPGLIGSAESSPVVEPVWFAGRAELGDVFYLLTDAVAAWFLRTAANGSQWVELDLALASGNAFGLWVDLLRGSKALKNDDSTALRILIRPPASE